VLTQTLLRSLLSQDFFFQIVRLLRVMNGQRLSRATVQLSVRWLKRARVSSSVPKSRARLSVLSVLEQLVFLLQMPLLLSVWM
jgi:PGDH: phosphoglycerate dehydrogenase